MNEPTERRTRPRQLDYRAELPPLIRPEPFGWKDVAVIAPLAGAPLAWFLVRA
jgi:hypothetical protein